MAPNVAAGLRAWAQGVWASEAGVELLIRAFDGWFAQEGCPWIRPCARSGWYWVNTEAIASRSGGLSGGERRVLAVVGSLIGSDPLNDLGDVLAGVDRKHLTLIFAAMAHAAGSHEQVDVIRHGDTLSFDQLPALIAWPADELRAV